MSVHQLTALCRTILVNVTPDPRRTKERKVTEAEIIEKEGEEGD